MVVGSAADRMDSALLVGMDVDDGDVVEGGEGDVTGNEVDGVGVDNDVTVGREERGAIVVMKEWVLSSELRAEDRIVRALMVLVLEGVDGEALEHSPKPQLGAVTVTVTISVVSTGMIKLPAGVVYATTVISAEEDG